MQMRLHENTEDFGDEGKRNGAARSRARMEAFKKLLRGSSNHLRGAMVSQELNL